MTQIIPITSESLQAQVRRLLPSQAGFGVDLSASSTITPIIDLTPTAEGSQLPESYQQAMAYESQTPFVCTDSANDVTITGGAGFWRCDFVSSNVGSAASVQVNRLRMTNGTSFKDIWTHRTEGGGIDNEVTVSVNKLIIFCRSQDSVVANVTSGSDGAIAGSVRQVADVYGNLVNPNGFSFE